MSVDIQFLSKNPIAGTGTTELRCVQPAAYLAEAGVSASAGYIYRTPPAARRALVLNRVACDRLTAQVMRYARLRGLPVVYDIDDLLFEGAQAQDLAVKRRGVQPGAGDPTRPFKDAIRGADAVSVSTEFLAERVAPLNDRVFVMKNGLSRRFMELSATPPPRSGAREQIVRIGYFSGSRLHDDDFAIIEPALLRLMERYPQVHLTIGGRLAFSDAFRGFGPRFTYEAFRPYAEFIGLLGDLDINLVPLDIDNDFAQARSELKFIEAGAFGVPSVASPTQTHRLAIRDGETGFLCPARAWFETLSRLVEDADLRRRVGAAARETVRTEYGPERRVADWAEFARQVADLPPRAGATGNALRLRTAILGEIGRRAARRNLGALARKVGLGRRPASPS